MAPARASDVEPVQKPLFGRALAGAARGALPNRALVYSISSINISLLSWNNISTSSSHSQNGPRNHAIKAQRFFSRIRMRAHKLKLKLNWK